LKSTPSDTSILTNILTTAPAATTLRAELTVPFGAMWDKDLHAGWRLVPVRQVQLPYLPTPGVW
jgi:hypothetical protein